MPERLMSSDPDDLLDDIEIKEEMEEEAEIHEFGALNTLLFVVVLVMSILLAFILKQHRCYYLSETAAVLLVGVAVGLAARVSTQPAWLGVRASAGRHDNCSCAS